MLDQIVSILNRMPGLYSYGQAFLFIGIISALISVFFGTQIGLLVMVGGMCVLLMLALIDWFLEWMRSRRATELENGMAQQVSSGAAGSGGAGGDAKANVRELRKRWKESMAQLRAAGLSIYELPWYLLIGEPGSGKSTTLRQSGLDFPVGTEALSGTAGTRNCDWWFTNQAVILDTAGRWTFNEANAPDRREWDEFLSLLKRNRPNCPINGVVVGIPADSLLADSPEKRREKAKNLNEKLTHLQRYLEVQFPVFIVVLKSDRILGFTQFAARVPPGEDRQLFGWSNPDALDKSYKPGDFRKQFDYVYQRAHLWRLRFVGDLAPEGSDTFDGRRRVTCVTDPVDTIFAFPEEFRAAGEALAEYVEIMFAENRFRESLFFRGFYFTSGLQEGQPLLKACKELLRASSAAEEIVEDLAKLFRRSRALFIQDFYAKKVFPEKGLVARSHAAVRREQIIRRCFQYGGGALAVLSLLSMTWLAWNLYDRLGPVRRDLTAAKRWGDPKIADEDKKDREPAEISASLLESQANVETGGLAGLLFPLSDIEKVKAPVARAHQVFFEGHVLSPVLRGRPDKKDDLRGVEPNLARGSLSGSKESKDPDIHKKHDVFAKALIAYGRWWRAAKESTGSRDFYRSDAGMKGVDPLLRYYGITADLDEPNRDKLLKQFTPSYKAMLEFEERPNSPRDRLGGIVVANYESALARQADYWFWRIQRLKNIVPGITENDGALKKALGEVQTTYTELLGLGELRPFPLDTFGEYAKLKGEWDARYKRWLDAYAAYQAAEADFLEKVRGEYTKRDAEIEQLERELGEILPLLEAEYSQLFEALNNSNSGDIQRVFDLAKQNHLTLKKELGPFQTLIQEKLRRKGSYEITDEKLAGLKREGMPETAAIKLQKLIGKVFTSGVGFNTALLEDLGPVDYRDFSKQIETACYVLPKDPQEAEKALAARGQFNTPGFKMLQDSLRQEAVWMDEAKTDLPADLLRSPRDLYEFVLREQDKPEGGWLRHEAEFLTLHKKILDPLLMPVKKTDDERTLPDRGLPRPREEDTAKIPTPEDFPFPKAEAPPAEKPRPELEPFEGARLIRLHQVLRTAKLQWLFSRAIEQYSDALFKADEAPPERRLPVVGQLGRVVEYQIQLSKKIKYEPLRLEAPDNREPVTVYPYLQRPFQQALLEFAGARLPAFVDAAYREELRPMLAKALKRDEKKVTVALLERSRSAVSDYQEGFFKHWLELCTRLDVRLKDRVKECVTWPKFHEGLAGEFGNLRTGPRASLLEAMTDFIKGIQDNIPRLATAEEWKGYEKQKAEFERYRLDLWKDRAPAILSAWTQFRETVRGERPLDPNDPVEALLQMAGPGNTERLVHFTAVERLARTDVGTELSEKCVPFQTLVWITGFAKETLAREAAAKFKTDWDAGYKTVEKIILRFPFAPTDADAEESDAILLFSRLKGIGKVITHYEPLRTAEKPTKTDKDEFYRRVEFPRVLHVEELHADAARFMREWINWRNFLLDKPDEPESRINRSMKVEVKAEDSDHPGVRQMRPKILKLFLTKGDPNKVQTSDVLLELDPNRDRVAERTGKAEIPLFADPATRLNVLVSRVNVGVTDKEVFSINKASSFRNSQWVLLRYVLQPRSDSKPERASGTGNREWKVYHKHRFDDGVEAELQLNLRFPVDLPAHYFPKPGEEPLPIGKGAETGSATSTGTGPDKTPKPPPPPMKKSTKPSRTSSAVRDN